RNLKQGFYRFRITYFSNNNILEKKYNVKWMSKKKFYVVWNGRRNGIFDNWQECKQQVDRFFGAKFMGFTSKREAEQAFIDGHYNYWRKKKKIPTWISEENLKKVGSPIKDSISVDGAWDTSTG